MSGLGLVLLLLFGGTVLAAVVLFMLRDESGAPSGAAFLAKKNAATELAAEASP